MNDTSRCQLNPIAELRLRQWARRHYVAADQRRDEEWHPIVLDEMRRCDAERQPADGEVGAAQFSIVTSSGIVPLEPSRHEDHRIDDAHLDTASPQFARRKSLPASRQPEHADVPYYA